MKQITLPIFLRRSLMQQISAFAPALAITELFYHFHSFSLEFVGFLATWFVLDQIVALARRLLVRNVETSLQTAKTNRETND
jgi:hypothetical protein